MPRWRLIALLAGVCLAGGLPAQTGQGTAPRMECHAIASMHTPESYWTREKMRKTPLMPVPREPLPAGAQPRPGDCRPPVAPLFPTNISQQPYASAGRLFFLAGGKPLSCTAQFTGSSRTLLTAAHCVRSEWGEWYKNFYFVQGYDQGNGRGIELKLVATWDKYHGGTTGYDYAFLYTEEPSEVGWLDLNTSGLPSYWLAIGYASNRDVNKERLVQVMGPKGRANPDKRVIQMLDNPMDGASGGAWIAQTGLWPPFGNQVIGLTSSRSFENCQLNSPLFDGETRVLFEYVSNQCAR